MTALLIILGSCLALYLLYKFFLEIASLSIILVGGMLLGFVVMFFNLKIGIFISTLCICLFLLKWLLIAIAGLVVGFVATPVWLILGGIKGLFSRFF